MALVVIGGVAAGLSAAARARRIDPRLEIVVLEKGPVISYGACGLPYFVEGRVREVTDLITYTPEYFRKERNIDVRTGARVMAISHPRREVVLESGAKVAYEKLIIATGARGGLPDLPGAQLPHVFTLYTLDDAARMRRFLVDRRPRSAVVIGAGYIGVEAADALRRNGLRVTILERSAHALLRPDDGFTLAVRAQLERHGVELRTGVPVMAIEAGRVAGVPADLVVMAAGFQRIALGIGHRRQQPPVRLHERSADQHDTQRPQVQQPETQQQYDQQAEPQSRRIAEYGVRQQQYRESGGKGQQRQSTIGEIHHREDEQHGDDRADHAAGGSSSALTPSRSSRSSASVAFRRARLKASIERPCTIW